MIWGICRIRLSLYVLQPFASAEVSHVAVARNVHVAAALTAIYHHPHCSVPDVNPTNNVFGAIDIYPPLLFKQFQPLQHVYKETIKDSIPR